MNKTSIEMLLHKLDGTGSDAEWEAVRELRAIGNQLPIYLLDKFQHSPRWKVRSSCVYHSIRYSRESDSALQLGLLALHDKSKIVRYRACMLLAYSLNKDVLPMLYEQLPVSHDIDTQNNIRAAIDAIENGNSDYFVDRTHSGNVSLTVR